MAAGPDITKSNQTIYIVGNKYGVLALFSDPASAINSYIEYREDGTTGEIYMDIEILDALA